VETDTPEPAPLFERFRLTFTYPSGTVIDEVAVLYPLATVEPVEVA